MLNFLAEMVRLGNQLVASGEASSFEETVFNRYYTCEVTDPDLNLTLVEGTPLHAPYEVLKGGSKTKCDHLYASLKFWMGGRDQLTPETRLDGECCASFWKYFTAALTQAGTPEILTACLAFRDQVFPRYDFMPSTAEDANYRVFPVGQPDAAREYVKACPIFMTYQGQVIINHPTVEAWWRTQGGDLLNKTERDFITGEECRPVRLIDPCPGIRAPLVSFHKGSSAFRFNSYLEADNFQVGTNTVRAWNTGMGYLMEHNRVWVGRGPADSVHQLGIVWWSGAGPHHPIFPIMSQIFGVPVKGGPKMKGTSHLWSALEALEVDDQVIHLASWNRAKGRFTLLNHHQVTCRDLKQNLLRFRDEWAQVGSPQITRLLSWQSSGRIVLKPNTVEPAFMAVITGAPYPKTIASHLTLNFPGELVTSLWESNSLYRNLNMPIDNVAIPTPDVDQPPTTLEDFTRRATENLSRAELTEFQYGVLMALYAAIKDSYHYSITKKAAKRTANYLRQPVRTFMAVPMKLLETYRNRLDDRGNATYRILSDYLDKVALDLDPAVLLQLRPGGALTQLGWLQARSYSRYLRAYSTVYYATYNKDMQPSTTEVSA
jgi:hypothetical protein